MKVCREKQLPGFPHLTHWCSTAAVCALPCSASIRITSLSPNTSHLKRLFMSLLAAGTITLNDPLHGKVTVNEHYLSKHPFHANTGVKKMNFSVSNGFTKCVVFQRCKSCSFPTLICIHEFLLLLLLFNVSENKTNLLLEAQEKLKLHHNLHFAATLNKQYQFYNNESVERKYWREAKFLI